MARISKLKTCFESESVPIVLGERYRFGAQSFDYPTGGAGTLINRQALSVLVEKCSCPRPDAPDDMVLGKCIQDVHIAFVHVPQMHQVWIGLSVFASYCFVVLGTTTRLCSGTSSHWWCRHFPQTLDDRSSSSVQRVVFSGRSAASGWSFQNRIMMIVSSQF